MSRRCAWCADRFESRRDGRPHRFCSSLCGKRSVQAMPGVRARSRDRVRRRRALLLCVTVETFAEAEVYERDGWTCGLCSGPVDQSLRHPDPMSVSLDHVVPLSKGGEHSRANTQCSHLGCNLKKGAA